MAGILFFDIRGFSSHRQYLAEQSKATMLTALVKMMLNSASRIARECQRRIGLPDLPWMNHTGDGFILVFHGSLGSPAALLFASLYREAAKEIFDPYNREVETLLPDNRLSKLDWGMGIHDGGAMPFPYQDVDGKQRVGFIGSALNLASRVEATTKDHTFHVICTSSACKRLYDAIKPANRSQAKNYFTPLGKHKLRGIESPVALFGCKTHLHQYLKAEILDSY